jgi:hypothetical protein
MPTPTDPDPEQLLPRLAAIIDDLTALARVLGPRSRSLTALADEHAEIEAELGQRGPAAAANITRTSIARVFGLDREELKFDGASGSIIGARNFTVDQLSALQSHVGAPVRVILYTDVVGIEWG